MTTPPAILALWSAPRSRSTAFLRMMAERGDYIVVHEPFSHVVDFGTATVGSRVARSQAEVIEALRELAATGPVFFKDTTDFHYPGVLADAGFLAEATHTFIIRRPEELIASHVALNPTLSRDEIGVARLAEIFDAVSAVSGEVPVVVDSDDLIAQPAATVRAYCARVGLPFLEHALRWRPGMRREWERTSRWHESTSRTSGFVRTANAAAVSVAEDPRLAGYLAFHLPYYLHLFGRRMRVDAPADSAPGPAVW